MNKCLSIIFVLNLLMIANGQASERGMASKSRALFEVISAVEAARYDLPVSYEVRESALPAKPDACDEVGAGSVVMAFEEMLEAYQVVFPDDELPYSEAIADFTHIVGESEYVRCHSYVDDGRAIVETVSFRAVDSSFKVTFLHHQFK